MDTTEALDVYREAISKIAKLEKKQYQHGRDFFQGEGQEEANARVCGWNECIDQLRKVLTSFPAVVVDETEPVAWWDRAVGGFYLSERTIPKSVLERGGIVPLIVAPSKL